jgi:hypothetical protein
LTKFAVVRNPWNWLLSFYNFISTANLSPDTGKKFSHHLYKFVCKKNFDEFVEWVVLEDGLNHLGARKKSSFCGKTPVLQSDWITDLSGNFVVDHVLRFENLKDDFLSLCKAYGIPIKDLPYKNKTNASLEKTRASSRSRKLIDEYFSQDFELFNYPSS